MAYITLTDRTFHEEVLDSEQLVLVEFFANWSGVHHIMASGLREVDESYGHRVKLCKIDADRYSDVAREYGVQQIPAILFFRNGQIVDHIAGLIPKAIIVQKLDAMLEPGKASFGCRSL